MDFRAALLWAREIREEMNVNAQTGLVSRMMKGKQKAEQIS